MKVSTFDLKEKIKNEVKSIGGSKERKSKEADILEEEVNKYVTTFEEKWPGSTSICSDRPFDPQIICANGDHNVVMFIECFVSKKQIKISEFDVSEIEIAKLLIKPNILRKKVFHSNESDKNLAVGGALLGGVGGFLIGAAASGIINELFPKEYEFIIRLRIILKGKEKLKDFDYVFVMVLYESDDKKGFKSNFDYIINQLDDMFILVNKHFDEKVKIVSFLW